MEKVTNNEPKYVANDARKIYITEIYFPPYTSWTLDELVLKSKYRY